MNLKLASPVSSGHTSFFCPALALHSVMAPLILKAQICHALWVFSVRCCPLCLASFSSPSFCPLVRLTFIRPLTLDFGCSLQEASHDFPKFKFDAPLKRYYSTLYLPSFLPLCITVTFFKLSVSFTRQ